MSKSNLPSSRLTAGAVRAALHAIADPARVGPLKRFFQTGPGGYGFGDEFLGPPVPQQRLVVKQFRELPPEEVAELVQAPIHECRFVGLMIWAEQVRSKRTPLALRRDRCARYLQLRPFVNNWDLVDCSAPLLLGNYLLYDPAADRAILDELAAEDHLWSQRIAMIATLALIRAGQFADMLRLAEKLLPHRHDLMHKAVGWMLREAGQREPEVLREFLYEHAAHMPRTALRYAIEKLPPAERTVYMNARKQVAS